MFAKLMRCYKESRFEDFSAYTVSISINCYRYVTIFVVVRCSTPGKDGSQSQLAPVMPCGPAHVGLVNDGYIDAVKDPRAPVHVTRAPVHVPRLRDLSKQPDTEPTVGSGRPALEQKQPDTEMTVGSGSPVLEQQQPEAGLTVESAPQAVELESIYLSTNNVPNKINPYLG